ncbi:MAG: type II secretion system protein [Acetivibrio ethanolgignens]
MRIKKENRGFSLVEVILAIAMLALLSGITIRTIGYMYYGNAKKCAARLESLLDRMQAETMGKGKGKYLYLFQAEDGLRMVASADKELTRDYLNTAESTLLGGNGITLTIGGMRRKENGSIVTSREQIRLTESNFLRIGFKKSTGAFQEDSYCETITLQNKGRSSMVLHLVERTGKHYVE